MEINPHQGGCRLASRSNLTSGRPRSWILLRREMRNFAFSPQYRPVVSALPTLATDYSLGGLGLDEWCSCKSARLAEACLLLAAAAPWRQHTTNRVLQAGVMHHTMSSPAVVPLDSVPSSHRDAERVATDLCCARLGFIEMRVNMTRAMRNYGG